MANVYGGLCSVVDFVWYWCLGPVVKFPMDTLNTLLLGWLAFGVLIVLLSKFLYDKVLAWDQSEDDYNDYTNQEGAEGTRLPDEPSKSPLLTKPPPVVARKATIVPDALPEHVSAPMATGSDPDAVRWINNLLVWFFEGAEGGRIVRNAWNDSLNEYTVSSALETGVLIEVLEFYPQTPAPTLMNIIVDCSPTDDMTVTCDMETDLYMRVQTTRTQRDVTTESEYACAVRPLRGRLNVSLRTLQCVAFIKFDGWPEVKMEFEGLRNNAEGLDELQLQEVLKEELTSALRKVTLELDFLSKKSFPRFTRERTLPESVIPVGYDALVREHQTHPPSFEPKIPASRTPVPPRSQKIPSKISADDSLASSKTNAGILNLSAVSHSLEKAIPQETNKSVISSDTPFTHVLKEEDLARKNIERFVYETFEKKLPSGSVSPPKENLSPKSSTDFAPGHNPVSRLSMVFSSREKPIDEFSEDISKAQDEEDDEEDKRFLEELKRLESDKSSLVGPPPPPRNPSPASDLNKESFKETVLNNPYVKHLPESAAKSFNQAATSQLSPPVGIVGLKGKRLLVKVVKASGVGGEAGVSSCYSVIEMDDPAQKFTTSVVNDTNSPFWDEQFLFDLSDNTLELLFELYDKSDGRFVGLGIVGIEELVATPSQRQIIPLQPRPYEKDEVTGSLTCEFLFLDRADLPDIAFRKPKKPLTLETDKVKSTTKTYTILPDEKNTEQEEEEDMGGMSGNVGVAEAVLKDLKEKPNGSPLLGPNTRSTVIIHSSRKVAKLPTGEYYEVLNGSQLEGVENEDDENYKPGVSDAFGTGVVSSGTASSSGHHQSRLGTQASGTTSNTAENTHELEGKSSTLEIPTDGVVGVSSNGLEDDRGRSRSRRKRDFFGSLRRRFSRSKLRSKSVDPTSGRVDTGDVVTGGRRDVSLDRDPLAGRSVSMERSASRLSSYGRSRAFLSVPKFIRGRSSPSGGTGVGSGDSESTRSSLSGTSGLSSASAKTYINEASILVVETLENGVIKHYLVPLSLQRKNKWKKKGTKLHIYNEHTFVAKHMSSSISCQVCQKGMGRRLGKQGYECRDCSYKCHKPCHVKTDIICPNSTINSMDLVYVKDDKANNKNSRLNS